MNIVDSIINGSITAIIVLIFGSIINRIKEYRKRKKIYEYTNIENDCKKWIKRTEEQIYKILKMCPIIRNKKHNWTALDHMRISKILEFPDLVNIFNVLNSDKAFVLKKYKKSKDQINLIRKAICKFNSIRCDYPNIGRMNISHEEDCTIRSKSKEVEDFWNNEFLPARKKFIEYYEKKMRLND